MPKPRRLIRSLLSVTILAALVAAQGLGLAGTVRAAQQATPTSGDEGYAHPEWLVDPEWVNEHLDDPEVRTVALTPADEFAAGHIPGAAQVDWPELDVTDTSDPSIAAWQGEIEGILTRLGLATDQTIVIYDGGTLYAARLWWVLEQLGHADKRILNGGFPAWSEAGAPIETGASTPPPPPHRTKARRTPPPWPTWPRSRRHSTIPRRCWSMPARRMSTARATSLVRSTCPSRRTRPRRTRRCGRARRISGRCTRPWG